MWEHEDRMYLSVKVDKENTLGLIAEVQNQIEKLKNTLANLKRTISVEEKAADPENKMSQKVYYLCDGKVPGCKKASCYTNGGTCKRTSNIDHAINFENVKGEYYREKENGKTLGEEWDEEHSAIYQYDSESKMWMNMKRKIIGSLILILVFAGLTVGIGLQGSEALIAWLVSLWVSGLIFLGAWFITFD